MGTVISVGDGIARIYGLKNAMAGDLLEFTSSTGQVVYGMAQNLEEAAEFVAARWKSGDWVLVVGAGDVEDLGPMLKKKLEAC